MDYNDKIEPDPLYTFRCPQELLDGLWELVPLLRQLPEYKATPMNRSVLLRLGVAHGLERLREILRERIDDPEQLDLLDQIDGQ